MAKTNTKTRSRRHRLPIYRRPWFLVLILLLILALVACFVLREPHSTDEPTPVEQTTTSTANNSSSTATNTTVTAGESTPKSPASDDEPEKTIQFEGEDPNTMESLTGSIARSSVSGSILTVVAMIDQYLAHPGTCVIVLKNSAGQQVYTASRDAIADVTTSICEDFEITTTEIPAGNYHIEITVSGDNKQGKINGEVSL